MNIIEKARHEILFATHSIDNGEIAKLFFGGLLKAAERGVKIKIIIDSKFANNSHKKKILFDSLESNKNIEVYLFNKINLLKPQTLNISLHDKILVVDNNYMIYGGRNIGDKYYSFPSYKGIKSLDYEVLIYNHKPFNNSSITQVKNYFYELSNSFLISKGTKINEKKAKIIKARQSYLENYQLFYEKKLKGFEYDYSKTLLVNKITLITNPLSGYKKEPTIFYQLCQIGLNSKQMIINSPYIVLGNYNLNLLEALPKQKTKVILLTNSIASSTNLLAISNYYYNRNNYLKKGIKIYEYQSTNYSLHAKMVLYDDNLTVIGSFNMDERSIHINTESMLVIDSKELNQKFIQIFNNNLKQSLEVGMNNKDKNTFDDNKVAVPIIKKILFKIVGFLGEIIKYLL